MAAASGVRTVALFGPTSGARNGPYGPDHSVVQGNCKNYPLCWKKRYRDACTCMAKITPDMVTEACLCLLGNDPANNPGENEC